MDLGEDAPSLEVPDEASAPTDSESRQDHAPSDPTAGEVTVAWDELPSQSHKAEPRPDDNSERKDSTEGAPIRESAALLSSLPHSQSSPVLLPNVAMQPREQHEEHELDVHARPALGSEASSDESDGTASSVAPIPTFKSSSYKSRRRDAPLRIFFPTEDLAMKAILSPPTLRSTASTGNIRQQPTLAESFLETTSRLFFLRGNNASQAADSAKGSQALGDAPSNPPTLAPRPSTASVVLEDDLSRLNSTVVATNPNLPPPPFANMFSCENCHEDIGSLLTQGRHHCRNCGGSFCANCSSKTVTVPFQLYLSKGEQRVCDGCFNRIRDFHAQAQTTQITWSGLPPPPSDVLVREFDLPPREIPVTVFNCSYFVDFAPYYGHLFLTREHICFRGYKTHKIKIAFSDLHSLIKPEFYYINALQINTKVGKEKHFFAEFNGLRDLCFVRMDQLVRAYQDARKKEMAQPLSTEALKQQALGRRRSYKILANQMSSIQGASDDLASIMAASGNGCIDMDDEDDDESDKRSHVAFSDDHDEAMSTTSSSASDEEPLAPDVLLSRMSILLDCELRADTQSVFELLWSDDHGKIFLRDHMEKTKDIDIDIEDWQEITRENESTVAIGFVISKEDDYTHFRNVRSKHPPKTKFPGLPPYAGCCRLQRLRVEKSTDGSKWTRFVVSDLLRMSSIPFSDYFEIESRWVFTRDGKHYCHVQAGLIVNFIKSTWFKSQIDSSTRSESKEGQELWAKNAIMYLQEHGSSVPVRRSLPTISPKPANTTGKNSEEPLVPRRVSMSSESTTKFLASNPPEAATISGTLSLPHFDMDDLLANPQSLVQVITVVLLLYCVSVIRSQQTQLNQLRETTAMLNSKLQGSIDGVSACEQSLIDGALATLNEFFRSQRPQ